LYSACALTLVALDTIIVLAYLLTAVTLSNGTTTEPLRPSVLQNVGPKCTRPDQLRDACCHLPNMMEDVETRQLCTVPDVIMMMTTHTAKQQTSRASIRKEQTVTGRQIDRQRETHEDVLRFEISVHNIAAV